MLYTNPLMNCKEKKICEESYPLQLIYTCPHIDTCMLHCDTLIATIWLIYALFDRVTYNLQLWVCLKYIESYIFKFFRHNFSKCLFGRQYMFFKRCISKFFLVLIKIILIFHIHNFHYLVKIH